MALTQRLKQTLIYPMLARSTAQRVPLAVMEARSSSTATDANDSSYFCALGPDGSSVVLRAAFRHQKSPELWVALRFDGGAELRAPEGPLVEGPDFQLGGLRLECVEVGRRWRLTYDGPLTQAGRVVNARFALDFHGAGPVIDFRDAKSDWAIAGLIGQQRWNRPFFEALAELKQTHIEQAGRVRGSVTIDGVSREVDWPGVRDHSYGKRKWSGMTRHGWFCAVLDDGRSLCVSRVKYAFMGEMAAGYVVRGDDVDAVVDSQPLEQVAASPGAREHEWWLKTRSGQRLTLRSRFTHTHCFDLDGVYGIREGMAQMTLDGAPGRGIAELGWNRATFPEVFAEGQW